MYHCGCRPPTRDASRPPTLTQAATDPKRTQGTGQPVAGALLGRPAVTSAPMTPKPASRDPGSVLVTVNGTAIYSSSGRGPMPVAINPKTGVAATQKSPEQRLDEHEKRIAQLEAARAALAESEGDETPSNPTPANDRAMAPSMRRRPTVLDAGAVFSPAERQARSRVQAFQTSRELRSLNDMMARHYGVK